MTYKPRTPEQKKAHNRYQRTYRKKRMQTDPEFRRKVINEQVVYQKKKKRYQTDPEFRKYVQKYNVAWRERNPEKWKQICKDHQEQKEASKTCKILIQHKEQVGDDPNRLSTEFILSMTQSLTRKPKRKNNSRNDR